MRPVEVIYLRRSDTVALVRELLLSATPDAQVWLVAPWGAQVTRSLVNLKQLQRTAVAAALDLRLVTRHLQTRTNARAAGIATHWFVPLKLRRYRREREKLDRQTRLIRVEDRLGWRYERRPWSLGLGTAFLSLVVIAMLLATLAGAAAAFVPSATVQLEPVTQEVSVSLEVQANPTYREVDDAQAIIPARVIQVILEGNGEVPATGRIDQPDGRATGEVVFINKTTDRVKVPKGTVVRTGTGINVRFATLDDVEISAARFAQARAAVMAVEPGPAGNVRPLSISVVEGAIALSVDVLNEKATGGGTNKEVPQVAYSDLELLRAQLAQRLQQEAYNQLVANLGAGEFIPPNSLQTQVMSERIDQVIGQQSDLLTGSMKVVVRGIAVDGASLQILAFNALQKKAGAELSILENSLRIQRSEDVHVEKNVVRFAMTARGVATPAINVEQVRSSLRGQEVPQAGLWLKEHLQLKRDPRITVTPEWWERMPILPARTNVVISTEQG